MWNNSPLGQLFLKVKIKFLDKVSFLYFRPILPVLYILMFYLLLRGATVFKLPLDPYVHCGFLELTFFFLSKVCLTLMHDISYNSSMEVLTKSTQKKETAEFIKVCMSILQNMFALCLHNRNRLLVYV